MKVDLSKISRNVLDLEVHKQKENYNITVSEEVANLLDYLKSKYSKSGIKILKESLILYDKVMEVVNGSKK